MGVFLRLQKTCGMRGENRMAKSDIGQPSSDGVRAWLGRHAGVRYGATLLLGVLIGLLMTGVLEEASYVPGKGFSLRTRQVDDPEYLRTVWADEDRKRAFIAFLKAREFFHVSDTDLVTAIVGLCDEIPEGPLDAYLEAAQACAEKPVPAELRKRAFEDELPFHLVGKKVTIGVPPPEHQPSRGRANVCRTGEWYRRDVLLTNETDAERQVKVRATGHYGQGICGPQIETADFQLNQADALTILDGPLAKREEGVFAVIVR